MPASNIFKIFEDLTRSTDELAPRPPPTSPPPPRQPVASTPGGPVLAPAVAGAGAAAVAAGSPDEAQAGPISGGGKVFDVFKSLMGKADEAPAWATEQSMPLTAHATQEQELANSASKILNAVKSGALIPSMGPVQWELQGLPKTGPFKKVWDEVNDTYKQYHENIVKHGAAWMESAPKPSVQSKFNEFYEQQAEAAKPKIKKKEIPITESEEEPATGEGIPGTGVHGEPITLKPSKGQPLPKGASMASSESPEWKYNLPFTDFDTYQHVGPKLGSNPGGSYTDAKGQRWYIKQPNAGYSSYSKPEDLVANEMLANSLYRIAGVNVPEMQVGKIQGQPAIASKWIDLKPHPDQIDKVKPYLQKDFAIDAWLANWDVAGQGFDNVIFDPANPEKFYRVDQGGSLVYRAQGAPKKARGLPYTSDVHEIYTLRGQKPPSIKGSGTEEVVNPSAHKIFGDMTSEQLRASAKKLEAINPFDVADQVAQFGPKDPIAQRNLTALLLRRRANILATLDPAYNAEGELKRFAEEWEKTYHGHHYPFEGEGIKIDYEGGWWSTPDKKLGEMYGKLKEFQIKTKDFLRLDAQGKIYSSVNSYALKKAREGYYPGIIIDNIYDAPAGWHKGDPKTVVITLDPVMVRHPEAAFDPNKASLNNLLASGAGIIVGGATAAALTGVPDQAQAAPWDIRFMPGRMMSAAGKTGYTLEVAKAPKGLPQGENVFAIVDNKGDPTGYVHTRMGTPKDPTQLYIKNIDTQGGSQSLGKEVLEDLFRQLRAAYPDAESIGGYRISGMRAKEDTGKGAAATKVGLAGAAGVAGVGGLPGDDDKAEAADLSKIGEMFGKLAEGKIRNFWQEVPEGQIYVRSGRRPGLGKTLEIANVKFDEDKRGKGDYTKYLDEIEANAKRQGFDSIYLENVENPRLVPYYKKRGYEEEDSYNKGSKFYTPSFYKKLGVGAAAGGAASLAEGDDEAQAGEPDLAKAFSRPGMVEGLRREGERRLAKGDLPSTGDEETPLASETKKQFREGLGGAARGMMAIAGDPEAGEPGEPLESFGPEASKEFKRIIKGGVDKDWTQDEKRMWQRIAGAGSVMGGVIQAAGSVPIAAVMKMIDHFMKDESPESREAIKAIAQFAMPAGGVGAAGKLAHLSQSGAKVTEAIKAATVTPLRKVFSPQSVTQSAEDMGAIIRQKTGVMARFTEMTRGALGDDPTRTMFQNLTDNFERRVNDLDEAGQRQLLRYIENRSSSVQNIYSDPVEQARFQLIADEIRNAMQQRQQLIEQLPKHVKAQFIEDYIAHYWEDPVKARQFAQWWEHSGPSAKSHLKKRSIPTIEEGIGYGLKPISTNAIDITMRYVESMDRYIAHQQILETAEAQGMVKWLPRGSYAIPEGWKPLKGRYTEAGDMVAAAPEDAARVYNRFSSTGIEGERLLPLYERIQLLGNAVTAMELGMSAFHLTTMAQEAAVSQAATAAAMVGGAITKTAKGEFRQAVTLLGGAAKQGSKAGLMAATSGASLAAGAKVGAAVTAVAGPLIGVPAGITTAVAGMVASGLPTLMRGSKLQNVYLGRSPASAGAAYKHIANLGAAAGARFKGKGHTLREYSFSPSGSFFTTWKRAGLKGVDRQFKAELKTDFAKGMINQLGRIFETVSQPLFEVYIPKLKTGAFYDTMKSWLDANPHAPLDDQVAVARKVWDSIDNRFGELVQDNIFWTKTSKQLAMLAMRSYSWNMGTLREIGGGIGKAVRSPRSLSIEGKEWDPRAGYIIALPVISALMGSVYMYLKTGKTPGDGTPTGMLRDMLVPPTGGEVAGVGSRGSVPERAQLPGYMRDVFGWFNDWQGEITNKLATGPRLAWEMWSGKDWRGDPIQWPEGQRPEDYWPPMIKGAPVPDALKDYLTYLFAGTDPQLGPISIRNLMRGEKTGSGLTVPEQFLGIRPASMYMQDPEGMERAKWFAQRKAGKIKARHLRQRERAYGPEE